jgi:hypothetical protein
MLGLRGGVGSSSASEPGKSGSKICFIDMIVGIADVSEGKARWVARLRILLRARRDNACMYRHV